MLTVGLLGGCLNIISLVCHFFFSRETARYRLKYCLEGPLNPKQAINQISLNRVVLQIRGVKS